MRLHNNVLLVSLAASFTLCLAACGDDKGTSDSDGTTSTTASGTDTGTAPTGTSTGDPGTTDLTTGEPSTGEPTTGDTSTGTSSTGEPTGGPSTGEPTGGLTTTGETGTTTDEDTTTGGGLSFAADVYPVLNPPASCDCHNPGSGGLKMGDVDTAYMQLVGVMSTEAPLNRIEPGDTEASYLWHKINGTHIDAGGSGKMMPLGAPPLPQGTIDLIQEWIDGGAKP